MPPIVHAFDPPERFVAGTVGDPGARTFFLQAREGSRVVSVDESRLALAAAGDAAGKLGHDPRPPCVWEWWGNSGLGGPAPRTLASHPDEKRAAGVLTDPAADRGYGVARHPAA